ncbi:U4/U6.U5 small nuclear ribonucleoprotein 27 kDa protein-like [Argopecten irradians]|uniref:U4/U6.U5 small nuclear ribonucleoprotein 27 kDa protein-like n=1 Tax=Argopecten irradians TaxID=31199 RepID=UPI00371F7616
MPRSRSRSPRRERRRSRERRRHRKSRSRSRSPRRRSRDRYRSRSPSHRHRERKSRDTSDRRKSTEHDQYQVKPPVVDYTSDHEVYEIEDDDDVEVVEEPAEAAIVKSEAAMMKAMGFVSFDTTKGKKVQGNDIYVANTARKRRYRQYMNRRGGFNRPLDFIA